MKKCIWCRNNNDDIDVEHIFPESIGCPEDFTLKDHLVCKKCNSKLAHLDAALLNDLDIVLFWHKVPRKNKRMPMINTRGNILGKYVDGKKEFKVNMTSKSVNLDGEKLGGYGKSKRNIYVNSKFHPESKVSNSFSVPFGTNKKVIRALYKIAFSMLAHYMGRNEVMKEKYDGIRKYVMSGKGIRKVILSGESGYNQEFRNQAWPPYIKDGEYSITFRLAYIEFVIDLSEDMVFYPVLFDTMNKYKGSEGWTYLPNDDIS